MNSTDQAESHPDPGHSADPSSRLGQLAALPYIETAVFILAFLLVAFGQNRFTRSDARGTLLVSEAILTHRTVRLDDYPTRLFEGQYEFELKNGHWYYWYPVGTSIASLPFVAVARGFGFDIRESEPELQIVIAAIVSLLTLFFMLRLARLFLGRKNSLLIASLFWFGSALASSGATALWSNDFAALFALIAIFLTIAWSKKGGPSFWPITTVLMFWAYLCRPTLMLLAPAILIYIFSYRKDIAFKSGFLLLACMGAFVAFSLHEFRQILPDYYLAQGFSGGKILEGLYGSLLSPSRGLLVFSPFILVAWACIGLSKKTWGLRKTWLLIGLGWPMLHWFLLSTWTRWWGGFSYGPRLMMDVLPGLFLLTLYTWPTTARGLTAKIPLAALALSASFAVFVNSGEGLFNRWTATWNSTPSIDVYPEYVFDWTYPQFLANEKGQEDRLIRHAIAHSPWFNDTK